MSNFLERLSGKADPSLARPATGSFLTRLSNGAPMTPTHPTFIDTFTKLNTPDEGFGTTLELTGKQRRTERSAERETMRIKRRMDRAGRSEEFEQFLAQNGRTGVISEVDIAA